MLKRCCCTFPWYILLKQNYYDFPYYAPPPHRPDSYHPTNDGTESWQSHDFLFREEMVPNMAGYVEFLRRFLIFFVAFLCLSSATVPKDQQRKVRWAYRCNFSVVWMVFWNILVLNQRRLALALTVVHNFSDNILVVLFTINRQAVCTNVKIACETGGTLPGHSLTIIITCKL